MLEDMDGYLITVSLDKKNIVKIRPFSSAKTENIQDYLMHDKRTLIQVFSSFMLIQITCLQMIHPK